MALGWDGHNPEAADRHRHFVVSINDGTGRSRPLRVGPRSFVPVSASGHMGHRDIGDFRSFFTRAHRPGAPPSAEDGVNPLLRRSPTVPEPQGRRRYPHVSGWPLDDNPSQPGFDGTMAILGELAQSLPPIHGGRAGDVAFQLRIRGPNGLRENDFPPLARSRGERRDGATSEHPNFLLIAIESRLCRE